MILKINKKTQYFVYYTFKDEDNQTKQGNVIITILNNFEKENLVEEIKKFIKEEYFENQKINNFFVVNITKI